ncbi:MAG TPA: hypothetical protein VE736_05190 [Gaiellaceae bacterium]|nr:hypothetical protein [Gaiellaceae bacterium]
MTTNDLWTYTNTSISQRNLTGFSVEALDGSIGKVADATYDIGQSFIVVDTGPWIFGKKVMLPAGVVRDVDPDTETVFVGRTKDQIKNAPELDEDRLRDAQYRDELGGYYGPGGLGYREPY